MNRNPEIESVIFQLKPYLKNYLEGQGVKFSKGSQFHCFNAKMHNNDDRTASASITKDGLGYKCFTCGITGDILTACNYFEGRATKGKEFIDTLKHLAGMFGINHQLDEKRVVKKIAKYEKETEYIYTDLNNQPIYKIVRMVNRENKRDKQFYPCMFDATKNEFDNKAGFSSDCEKKIYRLVEVNKAIKDEEYVFFVEGEKCVEILRSIGLTATCVSGGANAWVKPHSNKYVASLCNVKIVILPDNDAPGRKFANQVAKDIAVTANEVKILELEGLPPKGDIEQWLQLGGTKEKLLELTEKTAGFTGEKEVTKMRSVYVHDRTYRRRGKEEDKTISNFVIIASECVEENGTHYFFANVITEEGKSIPVEFSSAVFINKTSFKTFFQNSYLSFTGNDEDLQAIKLLISDGDYNFKTGVKYIGIHKFQDKYVFVGNDKSLTRENAEDDSTVLMPAYKVIETSILENDTIVLDDLKLTVECLFNYNTLDKTASIMGFLSACFFKAHFMEEGIDFPHLLIFGEAGSGKTQTVERIIKPFFSVKQSFSTDQLTPFTTMKICSSSNVIPFVIEEYKPKKISDRIKNTISALLRNAYNNFSGVRGTSDQSMKSYNLINPIVLLGEESIIEPAIQERSIELSFAKADLNEETSAYFRGIQGGQELVRKFGKTVLLTALNTTPKSVSDLYRKLEIRISREENLQSRIINNICVIATGLSLLDKALHINGTSIKECTGYDINTLIDAIIKTVRDNLLSENGNSMSTVDSTIEIFDRMAVQDKLTPDIDYTHVITKEGKEQIALDIKLIYDKFTKYYKEFNLQEEIITNQTAFTKQLRKADYFADYRTVKFKKHENGEQGSSSKRAYLLDVHRLNEKLELQKLVSKVFIKVDDEDE